MLTYYMNHKFDKLESISVSYWANVIIIECTEKIKEKIEKFEAKNIVRIK